MISTFMKNKWQILLALVVLFWILNGIFYVLFADTTFDEGNLLFKSYLYASGKDRMYSGDTWTEYMPGGYLLFGPTQKVFGENFYPARTLSFLVGFLVLISTYFLAKNISGSISAILTVSLMVINSTLVQSYSVVASYSLTSFFLVTSLLVFSSKLKPLIKIVISIFLMTLTVFARSTMIPNLFVFILYLILLFRKNKLLQSISFLSPLFFLIILFAPFFPGILQIFLHLPVIDKIAMNFGYPADYLYYYDYKRGGDILKAIFSFFQFLKHYQMWTLAFSSLIMVIFFSSKTKLVKKIRLLFSQNNYFFGFLIFLFVFNVFVHVLGSYDHCPKCIIPYFNYFSPLGAITLGVLTSVLVKFTKEDLFESFVFTLIFLIVCFIGTSTLSNIFIRPFNETSLKRIETVTNDIKGFTKNDDKIFSLTIPQYLFLSERNGFGPLINMEYGLRNTSNTNLLTKVGLWNIEMAEGWIEKESAWVFVSRNSAGSLSEVKPEIEKKLMFNINQNFDLFKTYPDAWQGPLYIYKKK